MKPKGLSRPAWRWTALAIVLLACAVALFLIHAGRRAPQKQVAEVTSAHAAATRAGTEKADAHLTSPRPHDQPVTAVIKDELCGVSDTDLARAKGETLGQHVARVTDPVLSRWKSSLAASDDPRRQAIALALANAKPGPGPRPGDEPTKDTPVNNSLVLLAMQSDDPAVYALALRQCLGEDYRMAAGPCQALSFEHWTAIAPENAIPWLWIAARANRAGDDQGVEVALGKASASGGIEEYGTALYVQAMGALPVDASPLDKAAAGAEVNSIFLGGAPIEIASLCSGPAIQQPLRRKQCSAITTSLAKGGSTMLDLVTATRMADRLGLPEEMRRALGTEMRNAFGAVLSAPSPWSTSDPDPWTDVGGGTGFHCATVRRYDAFIDAILVARGNERAAFAAVSRTLQGTE